MPAQRPLLVLSCLTFALNAFAQTPDGGAAPNAAETPEGPPSPPPPAGTAPVAAPEPAPPEAPRVGPRTQRDVESSPSPPAGTAPVAAPEPAPPEAPRVAPRLQQATESSSAPSPPAGTTSVAAAEPSAVPAEPAPVEVAEPDPLEVTVVGTRIQRTAGSAHVINRKKLERLELDDPHAILLAVPGVYVRQEDGVGLRPNIGLRGGNADRSKKVTLMEDGVLFGPAPYSAPAAYYFPLITRMSAVRVIKGPGAIAYGPQTVGGAVDLRTRSIPYNPKGQLDLAIGEYGYQKVHGHFGASTEQAGFLVEGARLFNSGFKQLPNGGDTGATRNEWMVKASYVVDPSSESTNELAIKLGYSDEVSNETYLGLSDADFATDPDQRYSASALDQMKNHRTSVAISHRFEQPENQISLTTNAYRHEFARVWRKVNRFTGTPLSDVLNNPDDPVNAEFFAVLSGQRDGLGGADTLQIGPNDRSFTSQGLQSTLELQADHGIVQQRFEASLRLHHDSVTRVHSEDGFLSFDGSLVRDNNARTVHVDNSADTVALAGYVADAITWRQLTFTPGVRVEWIAGQREDHLGDERSDNQLVALLPGAGVFYAVHDSFGFLGGVYRGFSPPPPGSSDVDPETSVNYEAGARLLNDSSRAELIGFLSDYSNLSEICTSSSGCGDEMLDQQFDAGAVQIRGLEAYLEHTLSYGAFKFPLSTTYTFTQSEFLNSFEARDPIFGRVERGDELPYVPAHQLNLSASAETSTLGLSASMNYVAATREQAGSGSLSEVNSTDDQLWFDVSVRSRISSWVSVYANARNLLNTRRLVSHRPFGARPNAPRWVQLGVKLEM